MTRVLRQVDLVAPTEANVLIQGESGTGKEQDRPSDPPARLARGARRW